MFSQKVLFTVLIVLIFSTISFAQEDPISYQGIHFEDSQLAFSVTNNQYWAKSDDGGMTWSAYQLPSCGQFHRAFFDTYMLDAQKGWAVGELGIVYYTENGGLDWTYQSCVGAFAANRIEMISENIGWVACPENTSYYTLDGGENWEERWFSLPTDRYDLSGIAPMDTNSCWMCGSGQPSFVNKGGIVYTNDMGNSWELVVSDSLYQIRDIHFTDDTHGYAVGGRDTTFQAIKYVTSDGGENWTREMFPEEVKRLHSVNFIDETRAWSCGEAGTIIHTEDAWQTYELQESGIDTTLFDIAFSDSLHGIAVGQETILVTENGGETWENRFDYVNYSPNVFDLYSPFYSEMIGHENIQFIWNSTTDFGSDDPITYNITLAEDEYFENVIASAENLTDTTHVFPNLDLEPNSNYYWRVKAFDPDSLGTLCAQSFIFITTELSVNEGNISDILQKCMLYPNYPNPFNPETTIRFNLPEKSTIDLSIYDTSGKLVRTLISGATEAGYHAIPWNGSDERNHPVPSGIYVYRLETESEIQTKRCILLK